MIFKGHFCFMHKKENRYYLLSQEKVLLKDFGKFALKVTGQIKDSAKKIAEEANRPYIYLKLIYPDLVEHAKTSLSF